VGGGGACADGHRRGLPLGQVIANDMKGPCAHSDQRMHQCAIFKIQINH
jgi:hypothetical protein